MDVSRPGRGGRPCQPASSPASIAASSTRTPRETLVHGWDLAAATRQRASFDDAVVEDSLAHAQQLDPAQAARPAGLGFADAVDAPTSTEPIIRLAAFFGRDVSTWS